MNEKIAETIVKHVDQIMDWVKQSGDFVKEQAPLICQEIIQLEQAKCMFGVGIGVFLIVLCVACRIVYKNKGRQALVNYRMMQTR